ncbi:hypothetical protein ACJIZ3_010696 [Penstemon smallii]|uniref:FAS1 domain-containing protein n=1 Tax=Penstemon smallii TaxID=265156 RepID=A0ABD3UH30_9LAMI
MASPPCRISLLLLSLFSLLLFSANSQSAPAPAPSGPIDIVAILQKSGQYTSFLRLLNETQAAEQINNQVNNSRDGMTVFAPTDNAFSNLPSGTLNNLTFQQHVQLVLYHICPKYYSMENLQTVSNPVRTQASGQDGGVYGLYFYGPAGQSNQVNVSTGIVNVPIYNAVRKDFPLAVYEVSKVLLPREFYEAPAPVNSPPPPRGNGTVGSGGAASAPATGSPAGSGSGKMSVGFGLVVSVISLWMGLFL